MGVYVSSYSCMANMSASRWGEATEQDSQSIKSMKGDGACSAKVDEAVEKIRGKLHSSAVRSVTNQDLQDVQSTIASLPNEDASAVMGKLLESELRDMSNQVVRLMSSQASDFDEYDEYVTSNDKEDKKTFFDTMAQKLDGKQLARMTNAFEGNSLGSAENVKALGCSIAEHASDDVKLEYILALKDRKVLADQSWVVGTIQGDSIWKWSDPQAQAAARVIVGIGDPAKAKLALEKLETEELNAVIRASADPTVEANDNNNPFFSYDTASFQKLMQTAAKMKAEVQTPEEIKDVADLKARIFNAAVDVLKDAESDCFADTAAIRKGINDVLMSDVNGVMTELSSSSEASSGKRMAIYAKSVINAGEYTLLSDIQVRLVLGNDLNGNYKDRFNHQEYRRACACMDYVNALNLGYFVGAMDAAMTSITSDANKQVEIVNAVISTAATVVAVPLSPLSSAGVTVGATGNSEVVKYFYNKIVSEKSDAVTKLRQATTLPFVIVGQRKNGELYTERADKGGAFSRFEDTWSLIKDSAVREMAKP